MGNARTEAEKRAHEKQFFEAREQQLMKALAEKFEYDDRNWWQRIDKDDRRAPKIDPNQPGGLAVGGDVKPSKLADGFYISTKFPGLTLHKLGNGVTPVPYPSFLTNRAGAGFKNAFKASIEFLATQGYTTIEIEFPTVRGVQLEQVKALILLIEEMGLKVSFGNNVTEYLASYPSSLLGTQREYDAIYKAKTEMKANFIDKNPEADGLEQDSNLKYQEAELKNNKKLAQEFPGIIPPNAIRDALIKEVLKGRVDAPVPPPAPPAPPVPPPLKGEERANKIAEQLNALGVRLEEVEKAMKILKEHTDSYQAVLGNIDPTKIQTSRGKSADARKEFLEELEREIADIKSRQDVWLFELNDLKGAVLRGVPTADLPSVARIDNLILQINEPNDGIKQKQAQVQGEITALKNREDRTVAGNLPNQIDAAALVPYVDPQRPKRNLG